ncbi:hypothetical protein AWZ03_001331 [Drosophila navojoa]|uniref:SH2 domain-containing protein n=1 Tax=Drosophila navojoa TaxID=7232 RepID=A0A484BVD7_DRONA|nr:tensin [Drosophila navojoa]TDG52050.1 hypothetical protein AWZ03_001331 [Drosophila navojoa]
MFNQSFGIRETMRSAYEDSAAVSTDSSKYHTSYSYNSQTNNNNNNYHKNYNGNGNGNGIPYHARENSLPFSYGNAKAATPLRKTPTPTRADSFLDFDFGLSSNSNGSTNNNNNNNNNSYNSSSSTGSDMIKPQPRLTSPLLVRKTLGGSRSNTNGNANGSNTNTVISNTYHYGSAAGVPKPRVDLEQLLGERRDKVFSEYRVREKERELERELERATARVPPTPPQRRQSNSLSHNKYNYDFEFNLNLNDINDRSSLPSPAPAPAAAPYTTRNIEVRQDMDVPDGAIGGTSRRLESTLVERNYHTINNSSRSISRGNNYNNYHSLERPPMEVTYKQLAEPQLEQQASIYGQNQLHLETHTRSRRDLSPIYAISTKRNAATAAAAPNSNGHQVQIQQQQQQQQQADYLLTPSPTSRPETPAFPVTPRTPFGSSTLQRASPTTESIYQTMATNRQRLNSAPSPTFEVAPDLVKFARNSAKFWYKPMLSREDAIALLMNAPPGTFLVRDSTTYANAYGLVLRVAQPPPGSQELVRHFLIEPTQRGVHLKGCDNEPTFTSLSALIYEHSINKLALPCLLRIPDEDVVPGLASTTPAQQHLLTHGAATNVLWLYSCDTESLTGNEAIRKAIRQMYAQKQLPTPTEVHFKVTGQGITLTDNTRKKFFRKHYTADVISHCAIDPDNRTWNHNGNEADKKTIFAFVARRSHSSKDNQCHVFCELSVAQPAAAIVSFANRTLPVEKQRNYVL